MNKQLDYEQAKEKALRLLDFRSHSERELSDKLRRAGADGDVTERVIGFCRHYGLVNDADFAERKARDLKNLKKLGRRRIEQELYAKGISRENIAAAVEQLDFDDAEDVLYPLVKKKLSGDFERKSVDRTLRYFIYRGYEIGDIRSCIERIKGEADEL